jgi:hypothetical protein
MKCALGNALSSMHQYTKRKKNNFESMPHDSVLQELFAVVQQHRTI